MKTFIYGLLLLLSSVAFADTYHIEGLQQPATIKIDQWGIPHIYAKTQQDAYFVQGFNIARERLWQMDLWQRRGLGTLSEVFGPAFVEKDRASRLFLYRGSMTEELQHYGRYTAMAVEQFVAGINAYVDLVNSGDAPLPIEFQLLEYMPARWQPEDIFRIRVHGLSRNVNGEVSRALAARDLGLSSEPLRVRLTPEKPLKLPRGFDLTVFPDSVSQVYDLATSGVQFGSTPTPLTVTAQSRAHFRAQLVAELLATSDPVDSTNMGSNAWAIGAPRSATGRPILASDPHRLNSQPSGRYLVHLKAPGLDIIGGGEPVIPGVSVGHNRHLAFGFTIFSADQEDVYQYTARDSSLRDYRYRDRWQPVKTIRETIPVRDQAPVEVELKYTQHGPVIYEDAPNERLYAVRAAWLDAGMAPYLGSLGYQRCRNLACYTAALRGFNNPTENHIFADTEGNIGHQVSGRIPRRHWDGLLPVPGDGHYEWQGYRSRQRLPSNINPNSGWVASANEYNLTPQSPRHIGYEWAAPFRFERIKNVLMSDTAHSVQSMLALQTDYYSIPAERVLAALAHLSFDEPTTLARLSQLQAWNKQLAPDSHEALFFELWWSRFLRPLLLLEFVPEESLIHFADLESFGDMETLLDILHASSVTGDGPISQGRLTQLVSDSLLATEAKLIEEGLTHKVWGDLHQAHFSHKLSPVLDDRTAESLQAGPPVPRGGSINTVNANWYATNLTNDYRVVAGTTLRLVMDVGDWDKSVAANTPGQSGDPYSAFYQNLLPIWASDQAFPLIYTDQAVETHTVQRIRLRPANP